MRRTIIFLFIFSQGAKAFSQLTHNLIFTHLNTQDGLSNNIVSYITQDSSGFIWIGTSDGLNRYDGRHFKVYRHDPLHNNSLPNSSVAGMAVEKNGLLWIGTDDGLCNLDPKMDSFTVYKNKQGDISSLSYDFRPSPFIDHNNDLWVATANGLNYFDRTKKQFIRYTISEANNLANNFRKIMEDAQHRLWCIGPAYISQFNRETKIFTTYTWKEVPMFYDMIQKNDSEFYVSHWFNGLAEFNLRNKKFKQIDLPGASKIIVSLLCSHQQNNDFVFAGSSQELVVLNTINNQYERVQHNALRSSSLAGNSVNYIFKDRQKIIWIATNNGVSLLNPQLQLFFDPVLGTQLYPSEPEKFGEANGFYEDENDYWVGLVYDNGLYHYDKNWNLLEKISHIPPSSKNHPSSNIFHIYKDKKIFWYSTDSGLVKYDAALKKYQTFIPPVDDSSTKLNLQLRKIIPYEKDLFFIRTWNDGLYVFDKVAGRFINHFYHHPSESESLPDNNINDIVKTNRDELVVSTPKGLSVYNPAKKNFITYKPNPSAYTGYSNMMGKMTTDAKGNVWISSIQGLWYFNTTARKFIRYTTADGLATNFCTRVCLDDHEKLWITTIVGISRFDPVTKQFLNFSTREGLPVNYYDGVLTKLNNGNILAGYMGGVVIIDPDNFPFNQDVPAVTFSEIKVMDQLFAWNVNKNGEKEIRLNHSQNALNISFAVLNFTSSYQNKFYYKLSGFDKEWRQSTDGNITYTNLSPAAYRLQIKGSNNSGVMNETGDSLLIIISPAFWQTWWFKAVCIGLATATAYWLMRRRIRSIRYEAALKQKIAEAETMALRTQMNPHFIFNCLNSIDNLIQTDQKEKATVYLAKFAKLIRSILENSKKDVIPCWKDLETLQLYIELEAFRWDKPFQYNIDVDEKIIHGDYKVPPMIIQPFVENAIQHGLLNKIDDDKKLNIRVISENGSIKYVVQDNGVGRKQAEEYKKLNKPSHQSLGVQITTERINLYNKQQNSSVKITDLYQDNKAAGTRVEVHLTNQV